MMKLQIMFSPTFLRGPVSVLGEGGEIVVKALWAGLNSSLGHTWPPGVSLPACVLKRHSTEQMLVEQSRCSLTDRCGGRPL